MGIIDYFMKPADLPYDFEVWKKLPFDEKIKMVCQAWALQGFGAPPFTVVFYALKIAFYIWIWTVFCGFSTELGTTDTIGQWWFSLEALGKALFWTILIEVIGFGGASGPLTARYFPPLGAITYYLRPGTIKLPLFPKLPILGNDKRNVLDVLLYIGLLYFLVKACLASAITPEVTLPVLILLPILGILDRQIYLAARADVWYPAILVFMFPTEAGGALKILWFGIWFWAAFSKLTPTFTSVVGVMICNSPFLKFNWLKKALFKKYPEDLRMSQSAIYISHFGTLVEFVLPITLMAGAIFGFDTQITLYALIGMTAFHTFIFLNFPMGVPMEWNVIMVYGGWVLFGMQTELSPLAVTHPFLLIFFFITLFILPIIGNFFPKHVSFLLSMRYYAGTWPFSIWLFKGQSKMEKLEPNIVKTSPDLRKQLHLFYDEQTTNAILSRIISFRFMHLPSRILHELLPKAVDNLDNYYWMDGEFVAGEVGGWNFGDGHLHQETLLATIQKRCHFESGELRVIMVESPQLHNGNMHWRIHDAKDGLMSEGRTSVYDFKEKMPWPVWERIKI